MTIMHSNSFVADTADGATALVALGSGEKAAHSSGQAPLGGTPLGGTGGRTVDDLRSMAQQQAEQDVLQAVEAVQYRIGQDLHDVVAQELVALQLMLQRVARSLPPEEASSVTGLLKDSERQLTEALDHVRTVARGLTMVEVLAHGLASSLAGLAAAIEAYWGVQCRYEGPEEIRELPQEVVCQYYRIAQEAAANAARHSGGTNIVISLGCDAQSLSLVVRDNGTWRQPENQSSGIGTRSMHYRAGLLGALLSVEQMPAGGTRVRCGMRLANTRLGA